MKKGQVSTEFLVIITIMFLLLSVVIYLVQEQKTSVDRIKSQSDTDNTISQIGAAAGDVYSQGEGARRRVFVQIPPGYDFEKSFVGNNLININVDGTDHAFTTDFEVRGSLPATYGGHWIWAISEGNKVRIGSVMFTVDRQSIYVLMDRGVQDVEQITIQNVYGKEINGTLSLLWDETDVTAQIDTNSFTLADEQTQVVAITFTSGQLAGLYSGAMVIDASSDNITERLTVPISIEVSSGDLPPPLTIEPDSWIENVTNTSTYQKSFEVCTNTQTSLPGVTFAPSPSSPGDWIGNTDSLGPMQPGTCLDKTFSLTVPNSTSPGIYTGFIVGNGSEEASDSINLVFTVQASEADTEGPIVSNIYHSPTNVFVSQPFTIYATADDSTKGNSDIKKCEIELDNSGVWNQMSAVDGSFNSPVEAISYNFGGISHGHHQINIRCTDSLNNLGAEYEHDIAILKNILFITKATWWSWSELNWDLWLLWHSSGEGYDWDFDIATQSQVVSGSVDTSLYAMIMITEYDSSSSALAPVLLNYAGEGGSVVILSYATQRAPKDLGLTSSFAQNNYQTNINIIDNSSYLTSGFPLGQITISYFSFFWRLDTDYSGSTYAVSGTGWYLPPPEQNKTVLGQSGNIKIWGLREPLYLNSNGNLITTRVIDDAIMQSTIGE